jgi:hypothetical protein
MGTLNLVTDPDLRTKERRWHTTGEPADKATWLAARLRSGDLSHEHLALAAYLDDRAAAGVLGVSPPPRDRTLGEWALGLRDHGAEACIRAAVSAARAGLGHYAAHAPKGRRPQDALTAIEAWLGSPSEERLAEVVRAQPRAQAVADPLLEVPRGELRYVLPTAAGYAALAAAESARWARWGGPEVREGARREAARSALEGTLYAAMHALQSASHEGPVLQRGWGLVSCAPFWAQLRSGLVPDVVRWALADCPAQVGDGFTRGLPGFTRVQRLTSTR